MLGVRASCSSRLQRLFVLRKPARVDQRPMAPRRVDRRDPLEQRHRLIDAAELHAELTQPFQSGDHVRPLLEHSPITPFGRAVVLFVRFDTGQRHLDLQLPLSDLVGWARSLLGDLVIGAARRLLSRARDWIATRWPKAGSTAPQWACPARSRDRWPASAARSPDAYGLVPESPAPADRTVPVVRIVAQRRCATTPLPGHGDRARRDAAPDRTPTRTSRSSLSTLRCCSTQASAISNSPRAT